MRTVVRRGRTHVVRPFEPAPGDRFPIKRTQDKPAACDVIATEAYKGLLGDIDYDGVRAEGFRTMVDFKADWVLVHDTRWLERNEDVADDTDQLVARFNNLH